MTQCANCGVPLPFGYEAVILGDSDEVYCSEHCARVALIDECGDDSDFDRLKDTCQIESDNPYENYGVSERDFY